MSGDPQSGPRSGPVPETPNSGPGRLLKAVLVISLALNLAVAGLFVGSIVKGRADGPRPHAVRDLGFGFFGPALTDQDRRALRRAFVEQAPDLRGARQEMRQDLAEVLAAIRSTPFDGARLRAALDRSTLRATERRALGEALILDHLAGLDAAERAAFADRLEKGLRRRAPLRDGARGPGPEDRSAPSRP